MNEALSLIFRLYYMFVDLLFNDFEIATNVTLGWVLTAVFIAVILIRSILNIPHGAARIRLPGDSDDINRK